ncbi:hypothetical protein [Clostridium botulinum]|uniref:hypothetical protein n=1 Tax=Clostridium botulinum TaxID=1491 RepID=UPI0004D513FC|nr:hypothetical protein [Clostridium botulinum]KEI02307.1 hypothetical protein Z953_07585 [Clostridium botulinum D str. 16868]KOC34009.1 hypothetical protein ADU81_07470 [Clostridium botulinum]
MKSNSCSLNNFNTIDEQILYICRNEYCTFLSKANVVGVGLGYKVTHGFCTKEKCIKVLVSNKLPFNELNSNEIIPKLYKEIKTDVYETGIFKHQLLNTRVRPTLGGYSISSTTYKEIGSIACIVIDNLSHYYILSCNHTIAGLNTVQLGTSIVQPSVLDNGKSPKDLIGSLYKFIPLQFSTSTHLHANYVDAALAIIPDKSKISKNIYILGKPRNAINPSLDLSVRKAGRTTNITYGNITLLGGTITISTQKGLILYKNQILTTKMSSPGDSGSLLMDLNNNSVGLIIGGSTTDTIVNPISSVLNALNVKIATN